MREPLNILGTQVWGIWWPINVANPLNLAAWKFSVKIVILCFGCVGPLRPSFLPFASFFTVYNQNLLQHSEIAATLDANDLVLFLKEVRHDHTARLDLKYGGLNGGVVLTVGIGEIMIALLLAVVQK